MEKKYFENSIYVLSDDDDFCEADAFGMLSEEEAEKSEFIEFDKSVADYHGYKYCAIYHSSTDDA